MPLRSSFAVRALLYEEKHHRAIRAAAIVQSPLPVRVIFDVLEPGMALRVNPNDRKYRVKSGVSAAAELLGTRTSILPLLLGLIAHPVKNVHGCPQKGPGESNPEMNQTVTGPMGSNDHVDGPCGQNRYARDKGHRRG
jgi:hypothetical protein